MATQGAISNVLIKMLGKRKENKSLLTIKSVMNGIPETHPMMNGVRVGRLMNSGQPGLGGRELAMYAHADPKPAVPDPQHRHERVQQRRPIAESEHYALKQENVSLKNQINQLKENLEKLKALLETLKTGSTGKASVTEVGGKRNFAERPRRSARRNLAAERKNLPSLSLLHFVRRAWTTNCQQDRSSLGAL